MVEIRELDPVQQLDEIHAIWQQLSGTGQHSYFVSWGWIEVWFRLLPDNIPLKCIVVSKNDRPICAFFVTAKSVLDKSFLRKRCAYLNQTGDVELDDLTIEYNSPVGPEQGLGLNSLLTHPGYAGVDVFHFSAIPEATYQSLAIPQEEFASYIRKLPSYRVDLASYRSAGDSYLESLSSNTRSQIRRSMREYGIGSGADVHQAETVDEALEMLAGLSQLHQKTWKRRGKPGAFQSQFFTRFHESLIRSRFQYGEIQILKIGAENELLGFIYNFVYNNQVLFYQSGLRYGATNRERPGLVSHYSAITHNLTQGYNTYNFLAGESRYKKSLATDFDNLYHVKIARRNFKWKLEQSLRRLLGKGSG